jgi:hypothetical protein
VEKVWLTRLFHHLLLSLSGASPDTCPAPASHVRKPRSHRQNSQQVTHRQNSPIVALRLTGITGYGLHSTAVNSQGDLHYYDYTNTFIVVSQ